MLLTNQEKQFIVGVVNDIYQNNSSNYYMSFDWQDQAVILSSLLTACSSAPKDPTGLNIYNRFGYHHVDLWDVVLDPQSTRFLQSILAEWMAVNGYYGGNGAGGPVVPGQYPATKQIHIVQNLLSKLNA